MINKHFTYLVVSAAMLILPFDLLAADVAPDKKQQQEVYQLSYVEREPGTDDYELTVLVSQRYVRIDETGENSGYILYDDKEQVIYSVGHHDRSILVINQFKFSEKDSPVKAKVEYLQLEDAPEVAGKNIYNYRVYVETKGINNTDAINTEEIHAEDELTCMELQLVEGILPEVRSILKRYQNVVSGQQVRMVDNEITEMQTACYYVDQIYNTGEYYDKGLPIQEWHSNERFKVLTSYKKVAVSSDVFSVPDDYKKFSIGEDSKTFIK